MNMIPTFIVIATLLSPSTGTVDREALRDALPVTGIVGATLRTTDGREFGEIKEIVLGENGEIAYYAIEPEMDVYEDFAELMQEEVDTEFEKASDAGTDDRKEDFIAGDDDVIRVGPENIHFNENGDAVIGNVDRRRVFQESLALAGGGNTLPVAASKLVDRDVSLADEESFGSVEDVLVSRDGKKAVALVVDNWSGLDKQRRAIPVQLITEDGEEITLPMTEEQFERVEEFDMESIE